MPAKKKTTSKVLSTSQKVGIGVGLTAAAVAAAGAYFLYGSSNAKQNRATVKSWALKAKAEVLETLEKAEEMTQKEYEKLVETVSSAYARLKQASKADIATFRREMKSHWPNIEMAGKKVTAMVKKQTAKATAAKPAFKTKKPKSSV